MMNVSDARRGDRDELADQRPDQPGRLGQADADHHHEDDRDRREVAEVVDERREQEADAVDGQQPLDLGRLGPQLVGVGRLVLVRADVDRVGRAAVVGLLRGHRRRRDDLVGGLDVEPRQRLREQDHARGTARGRGSPGPASCCRRARCRRARAACAWPARRPPCRSLAPARAYSPKNAASAVGRLLELVEQHALVGRVDVRVAVGGADQQHLGVRAPPPGAR